MQQSEFRLSSRRHTGGKGSTLPEMQFRGLGTCRRSAPLAISFTDKQLPGQCFVGSCAQPGAHSAYNNILPTYLFFCCAAQLQGIFMDVSILGAPSAAKCIVLLSLYFPRANTWGKWGNQPSRQTENRPGKFFFLQNLAPHESSAKTGSMQKCHNKVSNKERENERKGEREREREREREKPVLSMVQLLRGFIGMSA